MLLVAFGTYLSPKQYKSEANIQLFPRNLEISILKKQIVKKSNNRYFSNELEAFTSERVLYKVVDALNLDEVWQISKRKAVQRLDAKIKTKLTLSTDIINLRVKAENPERARDISAQIIESYKEWANERYFSQVENELNAFRNNLEDQKINVLEKRRILNMLAQALQVPYYENSKASGVLGTIEQNVLNVAEREFFILEKEKSDLIVHIETLLSLKDENLIRYASGLEIAENRVTPLYEKYEEKLRELESSKFSGLGIAHPLIRMEKAQIDRLQTDLKNSVISLREILQSRLELIDRRFFRMKQMVAKRKDKAVSTALEAHDYSVTKRDYEHAVSILQEMQLEFLREKVHLEIPKQFILVHKSPTVNKLPVYPNVDLNFTLGIVFSLFSAIALPFLLEILDTSLKTFEDVELLLEIPIFGVIPKTSYPLLIQDDEDLSEIEAFRIIRSNIESKILDSKKNLVAIVSSSKGEGKSTIISNMAYIFMKANYKTLLIDADMRVSKQGENFDLDPDIPGLRDYFLGKEDASKIVHKYSDNLDIIPSGSTKHLGVFNTINKRSLSNFFDIYRESYDIIFLDLPPIMGFSEVGVFLSQSDAIIMAIEYGKMPIKVLQRAKQIAEFTSNRQIIGGIINKADLTSELDYSYYYKSYYLYYYGDDSSARQNAQNAQNEINDKDDIF